MHTLTLPPSVSLQEGPGGISRISVSNAAASALISLQGAHLLSFIPKGEDDLIWLSPEAKFAEGKSVRGGIPICWPWFGAHVSDKAMPGHGHARTVPWRLIEAEELDASHTRLVFDLPETEQTRHFWPHNTPVRYSLTVGKELEMVLETHNSEATPITISAALHTYFKIGDIHNTSVEGLEGCDYLDKVENFARKHQDGAVSFSGETDRIYLNTSGRCDIVDPGLGRRIVIESEGSHSTVVWNPWQAQAEKMGDLGPDGYQHMLCVETANAAEDAINLPAGDSHQLRARYRVVAL